MQKQNPLTNVEKLLAIMRKLRDPIDGCPWDKKQTFESIVPHTLEEAYEVADAIAANDKDAIKDELGDLLFQIVFYAQLANEEGTFNFDDIAEGVCEKLIRRHPHVFGDETASTDSQIKIRWEQIKQQERTEKGKCDATSIIENIPSGLTPLLKAEKIISRCNKAGLNLHSSDQTLSQLILQIQSLEQSTEDSEQQKPDEYMLGKILFALVNVGQAHNVNLENALRKHIFDIESKIRSIEREVSPKTIAELEKQEKNHIWSKISDSE